MIHVRPATWDDAKWVGDHLRDEDEDEVQVVSGLPGAIRVPQAFNLSLMTFAAFPQGEDEPVALFGVSADEDNPGWGLVWLLATPEVRRVAKSVLKEAPRWIEFFEGFCPEGLHNLAAAWNHLHLRWTDACGFTRGDIVDVNDRPFVHIYRRRPPYV